MQPLLLDSMTKSKDGFLGVRESPLFSFYRSLFSLCRELDSVSINLSLFLKMYDLKHPSQSSPKKILSCCGTICYTGRLSGSFEFEHTELLIYFYHLIFECKNDL